MSEITRIKKRYLDEGALDRLLKRLFGSQYTVEKTDEIVEITAKRKLQDSEIQGLYTTK